MAENLKFVLEKVEKLSIIDFGKPKVITDFADAINIAEVKGRDYTFTFVNVITGNRYIFRIWKEVFDEMFKNRKVVEMNVKMVNVADQSEETKGMVT